jgi:hypothetical protein
MRTLDNPSPCFVARIGFPFHFFLSSRFNVRLVVPSLKKLANVLRVVPFVKTDVLVATAGRLRTLDRNTVERRFQEFDVVRVGAAYFNTERHTATVSEHRPLGSQLATIGRVFPGFFPHPVATWSSPRPRFASSTECLLVRRTPIATPSTTCERLPQRSIFGSNDATCFPNHTRWAPLSTGTPSAAHRKCRPQPSSNHSAGDHRGDSFDSVARAAQSAATVHRGDATRTASAFFAIRNTSVLA